MIAAPRYWHHQSLPTQCHCCDRRRYVMISKRSSNSCCRMRMRPLDERHNIIWKNIFGEQFQKTHSLHAEFYISYLPLSPLTGLQASTAPSAENDYCEALASPKPAILCLYYRVHAPPTTSTVAVPNLGLTAVVLPRIWDLKLQQWRGLEELQLMREAAGVKIQQVMNEVPLSCNDWLV